MVPEGSWAGKRGIFIYRALDENGSGHLLDVSQNKTTAPTLQLSTLSLPINLVTGRIHRIHYRINPTNAVTYTLRIWSGSVAAAYGLNMRMLYESPALQADDTDYDRAELDIPFVLIGAGAVFYSLEWTGAPGVTSGFITVEGEVQE